MHIWAYEFKALTVTDMKMVSVLLLLVMSLDSVISRQTYIVHLKSPQKSETSLDKWYQSFAIGHVYRHVITGFSARLSPDELKEMQKLEGFIDARPEKLYSLQTTHSPNFLGLHQNLQGSWQTSNYGKGVIVGVLDSGVAAGHTSFRDEGVPPPPATWKGKCELKGLSCNNKLIGARSFVWVDPRGGPVDRDGHGTHTASIAAGNFVPGANAFGQANGTASGMSPLAHLAVYKVCQSELCFESDVVAGMDAAIEDGVDVISMSIGGRSAPFYEDGMAIAAFTAVEKGILVSCAANNKGPSPFSLGNEAPWILTVGASTIDRHILATVILGNQDEYEGQSLYQKSNFPSELLPLVYAGDLGGVSMAWCGPGSLDEVDVKGKVVLCVRGGGVGRVQKGRTVKDAGGAAMILMNDNADAYSTFADAHLLPASHVSHDAGEKIKQYIRSNSSASTATILFKGTKIGDEKAPLVASFSSRGPNLASPGILKPDIIGPGSSILAAWSISIDNHTNANAAFNVVSGTSMSCPHLSGIAALIKSRHPDWTPAMIKSAIMTSATQTNLNNTPILDEKNAPAGVFAIGAGHVNPSKALDPGLVYDISTPDYISYLCSLYTEIQVQVIVNRKVSCNTSEYKDVAAAQLNYPSFAVQLGYTNRSQAYSRTVTNVGDADSTYYVQIENVPGVNVTVEPTILSFTMVKQTKTYNIYFSRQEFATNESYVQGSIAWVSPQHTVRIPVSVHLVFTNETSVV